MNASLQGIHFLISSRLISLCPETKVNDILAILSYHPVVVGNQEQWQKQVEVLGTSEGSLIDGMQGHVLHSTEVSI